MVKKSKKINKETFKLNYNYIIVTHYDIDKTNTSVPRDISLWNSSKTLIQGGIFSKNTIVTFILKRTKGI